MNFEQIKQTDQQYHMPTYARFGVQLVKGEKSVAYDEQGQDYIDFTSGIGVNSLGFCDSGFNEAVIKQLNTLQHVSNLFYTEPQALLAKSLCEKTGYSKAFFCNSGAEANECAIKLARKYSFDNVSQDRNEIITLKNSFHGRTITTITATGQEVFHNYFFPFTPGFSYAEANEPDTVKALITDKTCAVMIETIQGEGGVLPLEEAFTAGISELCQTYNLLLICDEVQTGIGRTGTLLSQEQWELKADIVTLAKGLGGGLPIGACLCNEKLAKTLGPSTHGTTFGGNPVTCAGALYILDTVSDPAFLESVIQKGNYMREKLLAMPEVKEVRGKGLMVGVILEKDNAKELVQKSIDEGLLILTAKTAVRFLPPLNITYEEIDAGLSRFEKALRKD